MDELSPSQITLLLNQMAKGDDKALERLYRHYNKSLAAFVRHLVIADEVVDDIIHDTFVAVYKNPLGYDGSCRFFTWLCAIAKNKALDHQRKAMRRDRLKVEDWNDETEDIPNVSEDVLGHFEEKELQEIMLGCIDQLPNTQREAIYWVYYHDMRLEDVANLQNSPTNTIKTRLLHARHKLRECLINIYASEDIDKIFPNL